MQTLSETVSLLLERINAMQVAADRNALDEEGLSEFERLFDMYERASTELNRRQDPQGSTWL